MRHKNILQLFVLVAIAACGTRLSSLDVRAVTNQVKACEAIELRAGDAGAVLLEAQGCYCGGKGILRRAGVAVPDGGSIQCPTVQ